MKKNHKRISAAVLSLALGFTIAGAPIVAPMAGAQASIISPEMVSTVDPDGEVSLTINKYAGEPGDTSTPLQSIFKVEKINLTNGLNTLAGWEEVAAKQAALPNSLPAVTTDFWTLTTVGGTATVSTAATTATNETVDADFNVGAYLVTETAPAGYTVSAPFIVTVPFTTDAGAWDYSQVVEPKNQTVTVKKSVDDAGVRLGEDLSYAISASLPAEDLSSLTIVDDLPDELSVAQNIVVSTTGATLLTDNITLVDVTDYTVSNSGNTLTVELTPTGLTKLNTLRNDNPGLTLQVAFDATVVALPTNGVIRNDAIVNYPNLMVDTIDDPLDPNDADTGAETHLGSLTVNKQDASGAAIMTDTATFELWRCSLVGTEWTVSGTALPVITDPAIDTEAEVTAASPLATSFTTDATGTATIYGVQAFDFENGVSIAPATSTTCLVETVAPEGYNLNPQPIPVNTYVDPTHATPEFYNMVADVKNLANDDIVNLPETGGKGTMAMIAAGVLVAAAGGAAAVRGNRARNK